ncbi:uncharacterized protein METZ01_LOCUS196345 [marine metagenome]|uniref:Uncharacterized protein n=1 Tax=marine metagenome TaxID=408172 RepID=A0A382E0J2_9ZZZZ
MIVYQLKPKSKLLLMCEGMTDIFITNFLRTY